MKLEVTGKRNCSPTTSLVEFVMSNFGNADFDVEGSIWALQILPNPIRN